MTSIWGTLQRTAAVAKDFTRKVPKPLVIVVHINGHPARALIDTGSLALEKPLTIQLAVQGSRSKVNFGKNYDLILGTPFLYQHKAMVGLHSPRVVIGSTDPTEMKGPQVSVLESRATEVYHDSIERAREYLRNLAKPLCSQAGATALGDRLNALRHYDTAARNTCPMLLIPKAGNPPRLRVVVDLRERNKNTRKLSSPMPDMDGILRRVARKPYRSLIDGADAYEQIRVVPEHVERTAVTTPGTYESRLWGVHWILHGCLPR